MVCAPIGCATIHETGEIGRCPSVTDVLEIADGKIESGVVPASYVADEDLEPPPLPAPAVDPLTDPARPDDLPESAPAMGPLELGEVVQSIYASYPLLELAYRERDVRGGRRLAASGAFDTKLKGESRNQGVGFYRTYRQGIGFEQPLFGGGSAFGGYRVGRGQFEPWYEERNTNDGGEFKAGVIVPLLQGRAIDERRTGLFRADIDLNSVEPEIRGQLLEFVRHGSMAYWDWVAAGRRTEIARALMRIALDRTEGLKTRVDEGDLEPIALVDNDRALAGRRAKVVEAERKLRQAAIKLSLFLRTPDGQPVIPSDDRLPGRFPVPVRVDPYEAGTNIARACLQRPEVVVVEFARQRAEVELRQARNLTAPRLDAGFVGSQDLGQPTSRKRDKSRLEVEAGLTLEVPLQRRKARGKVLSTEAKLAQINAKRRFTVDKIAVEVRNAITAVDATLRRHEQAVRALELARRMEQAERDKFDLGGSDLFLLNAREKQTAEAAVDVVSAIADHFRALADLRAAVGDVEPIESSGDR